MVKCEVLQVSKEFSLHIDGMIKMIKMIKMGKWKIGRSGMGRLTIFKRDFKGTRNGKTITGWKAVKYVNPFRW